LEGTYNGVSPHPVRSLYFQKAIAQALNSWALPLPAPAFIAKWILGEKASLILQSAKVSAAKILSAGYQFQFPHLPDALHFEISRKSK